QGIHDPDRVPVGFEYRVRNPLAARVETAERRTGELEQQLVAAESRVAAAEGQLGGVQRTEALQADQLQRLAQLEGRWRLAFWAIVGLSLALAVAGGRAARGRGGGAGRAAAQRAGARR